MKRTIICFSLIGSLVISCSDREHILEGYWVCSEDGLNSLDVVLKFHDNDSLTAYPDRASSYRFQEDTVYTFASRSYPSTPTFALKDDRITLLGDHPLYLGCSTYSKVEPARHDFDPIYFFVLNDSDQYCEHDLLPVVEILPSAPPLVLVCGKSVDIDDYNVLQIARMVEDIDPDKSLPPDPLQSEAFVLFMLGSEAVTVIGTMDRNYDMTWIIHAMLAIYRSRSEM